MINSCLQPSCKKSDQNMKITKVMKPFYRELRFRKTLK